MSKIKITYYYFVRERVIDNRCTWRVQRFTKLTSGHTSVGTPIYIGPAMTNEIDAMSICYELNRLSDIIGFTEE